MLAYLNAYAKGVVAPQSLGVDSLVCAAMCDWALHTGANVVDEAWANPLQPAQAAAYVDGVEHGYDAGITGRVTLAALRFEWRDGRPENPEQADLLR